MTEAVVRDTREGPAILGYGAYVPPLRVARAEIAAAHGWGGRRSTGKAPGERSVSGWDEDAITMAVDAARDCLTGRDTTDVTAFLLASTTLPFADRLNSGVAAAAIGLPDQATALDVTGSQRAATSALRTAFDLAQARDRPVLVAGAERGATLPGGAAELNTGHGAAAVLVGPGAGVARLLGSASLNRDFVDHFRAADAQFDYPWEDRWIRDEGYLGMVAGTVEAALADAGLAAGEVDAFCLPSPQARVDRQIARQLKIPEGAVRDDLRDRCGITGAAHPLLMLVHALEEARPGSRIVVVGFGQGVDALVLEVGDGIGAYRRLGTGVCRSLTTREPCSYMRYLSTHGILKLDRGIRAEADKGTGLTALYRHRDLVGRLVGGRCSACGAYQIPRARVCVTCTAKDGQRPHSFADSAGRVVSWSADNLTYTPDPPALYGMVEFAEGGRLMVDFTNIDAATARVGLPVRMVFRVKDTDPVRRFTRYFWKATPVAGERGQAP